MYEVNLEFPEGWGSWIKSLLGGVFVCEGRGGGNFLHLHICFQAKEGGVFVVSFRRIISWNNRDRMVLNMLIKITEVIENAALIFDNYL